MTLDAGRDDTLIWDVFNLDLIIKILRITLLNPFFSIWVPLLALSQRYTTNSTPFRISLYYTYFTLFLSLLSWSSTLWSNKPWRTTTLITGLFSGPVIEWEDQIVVITGGAGGVGRVIVETLNVMRVTVVVIDVDEFAIEADDVYFYKCDLANVDEIDAVSKRIQLEVGNPTILINNAGIVNGKLLLDLSAEEVKRSFDVNVLAQFALIKAFLPSMLRVGRGHIVTIASIFGLIGGAQLSDYVATKHALVGLHESLRYELKYRYSDPAIRTTLLLPSAIRTPLFASLPPPSAVASFLAPMIEPIEIAKAVIAALETDQSRTVYLPWISSTLWALRGLPTWVGDGVLWFSGANEAMRSFVPYRKKAT